MRGSLGLLISRNWPIKLAAVFFAIMLYIAVAAQQPLTQTFSLQLAVAVPPGRSLREQPPGVTVVIAGKGSEIIKLRSFPRVVRKTIPDTFSASVWRVHLQPSDVELPKGTDVQVAEITPRDIDERSIDEVPIAAAASGFAGFQLAQERVSVSVRGPESKVNTLTRDSLRVVAHLVGKAGANGYARLTVTAPPGIVARARPDSV